MKLLPFFSAALFFIAGTGAAVAQPFDPAAALDSLDRHFARELGILAEKCDSLGLTEQAKITREWQIPRSNGRQLLFIPPLWMADSARADSPEVVQKWNSKFRSLRYAQADGLHTLATRLIASKDQDVGLAYRLLHEALRERPDHSNSRQALGHPARDGGNVWAPYYPPPTATVGKTAHPKTGWQQGKYWRIDSKHWRIATNHSSAAGIELAKKLEDFRFLWKQIYFDFWCTREDLLHNMTEGIQGRAQPLPEPEVQMNVYFFRNRDEYLRFLEPTRPNIGLTQGLYADEQQTTVLYFGDESIHSTWYHEAAHQLFQQWRGTPQGVGTKQNFWLVEGVAMYVESLQNHGSHWTVGGWQADRLQIPRYRALNGDKGLPLQQLVALGREQVQSSPDIRKLYSQSAAEAHFLFDSSNPKYRQAASALLREIYRQNDQLTSLAQFSGASLEELDANYLRSLQVTDDDLLNTPGLARLRNLSLGRTQVTEKGLAALAVCTELRWLDLTALPVTDAILANFKSCQQLDQLFLDGTKISNESIPLISQFANLEELDLSNVPITDEALPALGKLRKLKTLHLSGSGVTPAGLQRLKSLLPKTTIQ